MLHRIVTPQHLGVLLLQARQDLNMSQEQLAARLGMSQSRLSELERGAGALRVEQLLAICQALEVDLALRRPG